MAAIGHSSNGGELLRETRFSDNACRKRILEIYIYVSF
jgi:hypothetical protein